ncbi:MAG: HDIG domain-containing protein [Desulfatibacillaceae bacterium]|nr:HDIG domain-containing protein [Desulfatibacillaceae bacterium]
MNSLSQTLTLMLENRLALWLNKAADLDAGLYLVGGCLRDALIGIPGKDLDLVCDRAKDFSRQLAARHNAAWIPMEKDPALPNYRVVRRDNPEEALDITQMHGSTINEDLLRRDFSINALAAQVETASGRLWRIIDPVQGRADLEKKIIRQVGPNSLADDPLRILRAFRFAAQLGGFEIEPETLNCAGRFAPDLANISGERIRTELFLLLNFKNSLAQIKIMDSRRILDAFLPAIIPLRGLEQNTYHHLDAWEHTLCAFENCEAILASLKTHLADCALEVEDYLNQANRRAVLKLGVLLHDVGKPATMKRDPDSGRISFHGHEQAGIEPVQQTALRLRLSNIEEKLLLLIAAEHLHAQVLLDEKVKEKTRLKWYGQYGQDSVIVLLAAMADILAKAGPSAPREIQQKKATAAASAIKDFYGRIQAVLSAPPLVTGQDLKDMGLTPGPDFARILDTLRLAQNAGELADKPAALKMAKRLAGSKSSKKAGC